MLQVELTNKRRVMIEIDTDELKHLLAATLKNGQTVLTVIDDCKAAADTCD